MKLCQWLPICTASLALFVSSPAWANHVDRAASGHGVDNTCSINEPCQTFGTPFGANGLSVTPYTFNDGSGFNYLDIFAVPGIAPGTTITFSFASLPVDGQFGAFTCGNQGFGTDTNPNDAVDATGNVFLSNSCTGLLASQSASNFLANPNGPITSWSFSGNGAVPIWWFYATASGPTNVSGFLPTSVNVSGSSTSVPEPSTMLLLVSGIAGLGALRRRRAHLYQRRPSQAF